MTGAAVPANDLAARPGPGRTAGIVLVAGLAAAHAAALRHWDARASYLDVGLVAVAVGALVVAGGLVRRPGRAAWTAAAVLAGGAAVAYLVSRGVGWPGASAEVGRWGSPDGVAALAADVAVLALAGAVLRPRDGVHEKGRRG